MKRGSVLEMHLTSGNGGEQLSRAVEFVIFSSSILGSIGETGEISSAKDWWLV